MRKLLAFLFSSLLSLAPVAAQAQIITAMVKGAPAAPVGYTGPGDVISGASSWSGLRAYNGAKATAGVAAIQVCTASDALCTDIHVTAAGGLSAADLTTSTCTTACTIKTWYDQTGNGKNITQTTIANRAVFHPSCISSLPCGDFDGINTSYAPVAFSLAQPFSINVAENHINTLAFQYVIGNSVANTMHLLVYDPTADSSANAGTDLLNANPYQFGVWQGWTAVLNGASSITSLNNNQLAGNAGTAGISNLQLSGADLLGSQARQFLGNIFEFGVWSSALSGTQITNLNSNQHTYGIN